MEKAELKVVELDSADIITTSGGGDGFLYLSNFGDGINNAVFNYGGKDSKYTIYTAPETGIFVADLIDKLNEALAPITVNGNTTFRYNNGDILTGDVINNLYRADSFNNVKLQNIDGPYKWDSKTSAFYHQ